MLGLHKRNKVFHYYAYYALPSSGLAAFGILWRSVSRLWAVPLLGVWDLRRDGIHRSGVALEERDVSQKVPGHYFAGPCSMTYISGLSLALGLCLWPPCQAFAFAFGRPLGF